MEWFFDGIGTAIITGIVGLFVGGCTGYKIGVQTTIRQKQKGRSNSVQIQTGQNITNNGVK